MPGVEGEWYQLEFGFASGQVIEEEGIILTTMRELMERRKKVQE